MTPDAQMYIAAWRNLALVAGGLALVGASVSLYALGKALGTVLAVWRVRGRRALGIVAWGEVALLATALAWAVVNLLMAVGLVRLADRYPADLGTVLTTLDGDVTRLYAGFVVGVGLGAMVGPILLAVRALVLADKAWRETTP